MSISLEKDTSKEGMKDKRYEIHYTEIECLLQECNYVVENMYWMYQAVC